MPRVERLKISKFKGIMIWKSVKLASEERSKKGLLTAYSIFIVMLVFG